MVAHPVIASLIAAIVVAMGVALAEWLHRKRVAKVRFLAFGAAGEPRRWTLMAAWVIVPASAAVAFGAMLVFLTEPEPMDERPTAESSRHLLICLDASPSMFVEDAGPDGKQKRSVRAGELIQGILDRIDTETTRVTVFAVYTKSIPVIEETFDMNVVRNLLVGLPLYAAFTAGPTKLSSGVNDALEHARPWKPGSTALLIISDGDSEEKTGIRAVPASIADVIVVGVGDPVRPTLIAGHRSVQETGSLKSLAARLKGVFHQGNSRHLPDDVIERMALTRPRVSDVMGLRDTALWCLAIGGSLLALMNPALQLLGRRRTKQLPVCVTGGGGAHVIRSETGRSRLPDSNSGSGLGSGLAMKGVR